MKPHPPPPVFEPLRRTLAQLTLGAALLAACTHDWDGLTPAGSAGVVPDAQLPQADATPNETGTPDSAIPIDAGAPVRCPPQMAGTRVGTRAFCIDHFEATKAEYGAFILAASKRFGGAAPRYPGVVDRCDAINASVGDLTPQGSWSSGYVVVPDAGPVAGGNLPVTFVDWCDAATYCAAKGKRLCGRIDRGTPYDPTSGSAELSSPDRNEWVSACAGSAKTKYPYGNTYEPQACRGSEALDPDGGALDAGPRGPSPVGSYPRCRGELPGVFDMSGNAYEWDDAQIFGAQSKAYLRGGAFTLPALDLQCTSGQAQDIASALPQVGIRCCADALPEPTMSDASLDAQDARPDAPASTDAKTD
jgi:formylglycine-generating enzyme required for sulfatase activity